MTLQGLTFYFSSKQQTKSIIIKNDQALHMKRMIETKTTIHRECKTALTITYIQPLNGREREIERRFMWHKYTGAHTRAHMQQITEN